MTLPELRELSTQGLKNYEIKVLNIYRRRALYDKAIEENLSLRLLYKERVEQDDDISYKDLSRIEYEIAFLYQLTEQVEDAIAFFGYSIESAKKGNDLKGEMIAEHCISRIKYFSDLLTVDDVIAETQKHRDGFATLMHKSSDNKERTVCEGWVYNMDSYLLVLAVEACDLELAEHAYPRVVQYLNENDMRITGKHRLVSALGMLNLVRGEYDQSLKAFSKLIDCDLSEWGEQDEELIHHIENVLEFTPSRDYLHAGRALLGLGRTEMAMKVFNKGLKFPRTESNYFMLNKIEREIEQMEVA